MYPSDNYTVIIQEHVLRTKLFRGKIKAWCLQPVLGAPELWSLPCSFLARSPDKAHAVEQ